jgi:hypothetical protein
MAGGRGPVSDFTSFGCLSQRIWRKSPRIGARLGKLLLLKRGGRALKIETHPMLDVLSWTI